jgi:hypothetical protein
MVEAMKSNECCCVMQQGTKMSCKDEVVEVNQSEAEKCSTQELPNTNKAKIASRSYLLTVTAEF